MRVWTRNVYNSSSPYAFPRTTTPLFNCWRVSCFTVANAGLSLHLLLLHSSINLIQIAFFSPITTTAFILQPVAAVTQSFSIHSALLALFMAEGAIFKAVVGAIICRLTAVPGLHITPTCSGDPKSAQLYQELLPDLPRVQQVKKHIEFSVSASRWLALHFSLFFADV